MASSKTTRKDLTPDERKTLKEKIFEWVEMNGELPLQSLYSWMHTEFFQHRKPKLPWPKDMDIVAELGQELSDEGRIEALPAVEDDEDPRPLRFRMP